MSREEFLAKLAEPGVWDAAVRWMTTGLLALMALAIAWEFVRQKLRRRQQIATEWRTVEQIARDKDLSPSEWERLKSSIARYSPDEPLRAATVRFEFDRCVEREMARVRELGDWEAFEAVGLELRDVRNRLGMDYVPYGSRLFSTREAPTGLKMCLTPMEDRSEWLTGTIVEVDEAFLRVRVSEGASHRKVPRPGQRILCRLWRDDDARYTFTAAFVRAEADSTEWLFEHTSTMERVQSREFFRIRYEQTVTVRVVESAPDELRGERTVTQLRARVTNLSAGGLALVVHQPVPAHARLRMAMDLTGGERVELEARIISTSPIGAGRWVLRANFANIDDETRESLVRFVMLQQQQQVAAETGAGSTAL
jgi:c-di-GMP-binding flagellar brake protein YcgR